MPGAIRSEVRGEQFFADRAVSLLRRACPQSSSGFAERTQDLPQGRLKKMMEGKSMTIQHFTLSAAAVLATAISCSWSFAASAKGPLVVHPDNPRYFMVKDDPGRKAVYLTGSHYWYNLQDRFLDDKEPCDYLSWPEYLEFLEEHKHNFVRGWYSENATGKVSGYSELWKWKPNPFARTGEGNALDGKPKFDLTRYNQRYFDRIRSRAIELGNRGIYISIMLFQGWSVDVKKEGTKYDNDPWMGHPFNKDNNINGINGDLNNDGEGLETHQLDIPEVTRLQEAYVKKTIDTLHDLDNIMWEISNESHADSGLWQYHMIRFIKEYEKTKAKQHLVGITGYNLDNKTLFESPADWISPNKVSPTHAQGYRHDPPDAKGRKIVLSDTDHLWGIGGNHSWVWRTFTRGLHPIFMDPLYVSGEEIRRERKIRDPAFPGLRKAMGHTLIYANKVNLVEMTPRNVLSSTGFCLSNPGKEYVVYQPAKQAFTVKVIPGKYNYEWFDPQKGKVLARGSIEYKDSTQNPCPPQSCVWDSVLLLNRIR